MLKDQCISVTDLRTETKKCLENLEKEPKYIFINNEPIAVLMDIVQYEDHFLRPKLVELKENEVDKTTKRQASKAKKSRKEDLVDI
ncbi:MAG: hypothetical protein WC604_04805 [Candidatus Gracilibacteria bacterium]